MATQQTNPSITGGGPDRALRLVAPVPAQAVPQWYAIYTWARHEKYVAKQLAERNIKSFLPLYKSWRTWKDRRKEIELALFTSYVFVNIAVQTKLSVLQLPGVVHLVSSNGQPAALPEQEIEALRRGLDQQMYAEPHPYLKVGHKVRMKLGPLAGTEGILVRKKDSLRLVVSLDVLMRSVAVEVDAADVVAA